MGTMWEKESGAEDNIEIYENATVR